MGTVGRQVEGFYSFLCTSYLLPHIPGGRIPLPIRNWRESSIPSKILDIVDSLGYEVGDCARPLEFYMHANLGSFTRTPL